MDHKYQRDLDSFSILNLITHMNEGGSVFIFELKDLKVIEISCTFANRNIIY